MNFTKQILSGSTDGKQIKVGATSTPGTIIHTAIAGTDDLDEIFIYAVNSSGSAHTFVCEWGETAAPDGLIELTLPPEEGYKLIVPGLLLQNGLVVRAYASLTNVILVNGYVNRIAA